MTVDSTPNQGSAFSVLLPAGNEQEAVRDANPSYPMPMPDAEPSQGWNGLYTVVQSGEHVLIVDDDRANIQSAFNILKLEGYTATAATNGKEALDMIQKHPGSDSSFWMSCCPVYPVMTYAGSYGKRNHI